MKTEKVKKQQISRKELDSAWDNINKDDNKEVLQEVNHKNSSQRSNSQIISYQDQQNEQNQAVDVKSSSKSLKVSQADASSQDTRSLKNIEVNQNLEVISLQEEEQTKQYVADEVDKGQHSPGNHLKPAQSRKQGFQQRQVGSLKIQKPTSIITNFQNKDFKGTQSASHRDYEHSAANDPTLCLSARKIYSGDQDTSSKKNRRNNSSLLDDSRIQLEENNLDLENDLVHKNNAYLKKNSIFDSSTGHTRPYNQGNSSFIMEMKSPRGDGIKPRSFLQQNNNYSLNVVTPVMRKRKPGAIISNAQVKNILMAHSMSQNNPGNLTMRKNSGIKNQESFAYLPQNSLMQGSQASEYNAISSSKNSKRNSHRRDNYQQHLGQRDHEFNQSYIFSQEPGAMYDTPHMLEQNQFDNSIHENYMMNRATALRSNREQISRNAQQFMKIKKKKKPKKQTTRQSTLNMDDKKRRTAGGSQFLQRGKRMKTEGGGLNRKGHVTRGSTFKKEFETTTNGSEDSEKDEHESIHAFENNLQKSILTMMPNSTFKFMWDIFILFWIFFLSLVIPYNVSFGLAGFPNFLLIIVEIIMIIDVFITMSCGYHTKGILVMQRSLIVKKYIRSWFLIDLLSALPVYIVFNSTLGERMTYSIQELLTHDVKDKRGSKFQLYMDQIQIITFLVLQMLKILKVVKIFYLQSRVYEMISNDIGDIIFKSIRLTIYSFIIAHWTACLFWLIGSVLHNQEDESWVRAYADSSTFEQYVVSIYWGITTMVTVGYGDVHPMNTYERLVGIVIMLVASGMHAYIINEVSQMVRFYNLLASKYEERMKYVNKFMRQKGIPEDLRTKIVRYLEYNWDMKKEIKIEENEVYGLLNENLRQQITVEMNGRILKNIQVFEQFSAELNSSLIYMLRKRSFAVEEMILNEDQFGNDIYFITSGEVIVYHKRTLSSIIGLKKDDHFGEIGFFSDLPRQASIKAKDYTDTMIISKENFLQVAYNDITALKLFYSISCSINDENKDFTRLSLKCYVCGKDNHIFIQCFKFVSKIKGNMIPLIVKSELERMQRETNLNIFDKISNSMANVTKQKKKMTLTERRRSFILKFQSKKNSRLKGSKSQIGNVFNDTSRKLLPFGGIDFQKRGKQQTQSSKDSNIKQLISAQRRKSVAQDFNVNLSSSFEHNDENKIRQHLQMELLRKNQEHNKVPHNSIFHTGEQWSGGDMYERSSTGNSGHSAQQEEALEVTDDPSDDQGTSPRRMSRLQQINRIMDNSNLIKVESLSRKSINHLTSQNSFDSIKSFSRRGSLPFGQNKFSKKTTYFHKIPKNQIIEEQSSNSSSEKSKHSPNNKRKRMKLTSKINNKFSSMRVEKLESKDLLYKEQNYDNSESESSAGKQGIALPQKEECESSFNDQNPEDKHQSSSFGTDHSIAEDAKEVELHFQTEKNTIPLMVNPKIKQIQSSIQANDHKNSSLTLPSQKRDTSGRASQGRHKQGSQNKSVRKITSQSRYLDLTSIEDQFFSPQSNWKKEKYGGGEQVLENRIAEMAIESEAEQEIQPQFQQNINRDQEAMLNMMRVTQLVKNKNYTKLMREQTQVTDLAINSLPRKAESKIYSNMKSIQSIRRKPKASRIQQRDVFSNKFFVEDFLEDINSVTILESESHFKFGTPLSNGKYAYENAASIVINPPRLDSNRSLTFKRTLSGRGNINVNPFSFINGTQRLAPFHTLKPNLSKFASGNESSLSRPESFQLEMKQIEDEKETDSDEQMIIHQENISKRKPQNSIEIDQD